jgi:MoaA/NifB/PqqE/SkfB family radical SAM enzyme
MDKPGFTKIRFLRDLVVNKARGRKVPLFLYWFITERCNFSCSYCYGAFPRKESADLPTAVMLRMIEEMGEAGVRRVNLLGGEPFMREDLGLLVERLAARKISTCVLSNGSFLPERAGELRGVDEVGMSIDGCEQTHDRIRGRGAYEKLIRAIEACRRQGITVVLTYTMVSQNVEDVDHVMEFVRRQGVTVTVNVAHGRVFGSGDLPVSRADQEAYRRALGKIIDYRDRGYPVFRARRTLELMRSWPDFRTDTSDVRPAPGYPACRFGSYGATLCSDGTLIPCFLNSRGGAGLSVPESGFAAAWEHCQGLPHCTYCHVPCFIEYNAIFGLSPAVLYNGFMKLSVHPLFRRART